MGIKKEKLESAIENIVNAEAISMDTIRVLLDNDSESSVPAGEERLAYCRHMLSNASLSMPAKLAHSAESWKGCCGSSSAFSISTYMSAFSCGFVQDQY